MDNMDNFDLLESLHELSKGMIPPKEKILAVIVDDRPEEIEGMVRLLEVWPNIDLKKIIVSSEEHDVEFLTGEILAAGEPALVLLDQSISSKVSGSKIAENLLRKGFRGVLASITGCGVCPGIFNGIHFKQKNLINKNRMVAVMFVEFINKLIKKIQKEDA